MPPLRNLVCQVEWDGAAHLPLREYNTVYGDGFVESYIAIPPNPTNFVIHLTSNGYIAPGLAMFVFIDGEYQCNRNRHKLLIPAAGVDQEDCEIDFRLRQKEYSGPNGTWEGKQWKFEKVTKGKLPSDSGSKGDKHAAQIGEYGGMIEVIVLRCYHSDPSRTRSSSLSSSMKSGSSSGRSSYMDDQEAPLMTGAMFDGAGDSPPAQNRGRSHRSTTFEAVASDEVQGGSFRGKPPLLLRLRGGEGSPPEPDRGRSRRHQKNAKDESRSRFRLGGGLLYSGEDRGLSRQFHKEKGNEGQPPLLLRGGGSEGNRSNKEVQSPALSSKPYRLGRGDLPTRTKTPKGFTGLYVPEETWGTGGGAKKPKKGSTGSYTPDETWGISGAAKTDDQWRTENIWTWGPEKKSGNSKGGASSDMGRKENKQRSSSNVSSQKRDSKSTDRWDWGGETKADTNKNNENWGADNAQKMKKWDYNDKDQKGNNGDTAGKDEDRKDQQHSRWDAVNNGGNDNQNDQGSNTDNGNNNQDDNLGDNATKNDQNDQNNDRDTVPDQNNDQDRGWNSGMGNNNAQSGSWDNGGAKTPTQKSVKKRTPSKAPSNAGSLANRSKSRSSQGRISRPPSTITPINKLNASRRVVSKAPSVTSLKSALKIPFGSGSPAKPSPVEVSDEVADKGASIPGAWSPPLEKMDKKTRSESTRRRAAEFNAERAKAQGAELEAESPKVRSRDSKPITPLSAPVFKPCSKSTTPATATCRSKVYQSHRKRPSTIVEEQNGTANVTKDDGPTREIRALSPAEYTHKTSVPHYMDTIADPYAHFVFHCREMDVISKMCGVTIIETKEEMQNRLASLTKAELLELLLEGKMAANEEIDEQLTWKSSSSKAGYNPNLNAANEKLHEWGKNNDDSGGSSGNDWGNNNSGVNDSGNDMGRGDNWRNNGNSRGDGSDSNNSQGEDSWGNDNNNFGYNQEGGDWGNSNDNSGEHTRWGDSNSPGNNNSWGGGDNGGGDSGGW